MAKITIQTIAKVAGVHPSTVSRALNGDSRLPEDRIKQIEEVAESLGYRPNVMAKGLAGKRTNTVGIIVPKLTDLHAVSLVNAEESWLRGEGFTTMLAITNCEEKSELKAIDDLVDRAVDGLAINYPPVFPSVIDKLKKVSEKGIPVSMIGQDDSGLFDVVDVDFVKWTKELVKYLLELGHRKIAMVVDERIKGLDRDNCKLNGYLKALEEYGVEFDENLIFEQHYAHQDVSSLTQRIMCHKDRPTAIFAYNDDLAGELMKELVKVGYKVPEDVSVVGFNDNWFSDRLRIPLTTCKLPADDIGQALVEMIVDRIDNPEVAPARRILDCELKLRSSTCKLNTA